MYIHLLINSWKNYSVFRKQHAGFVFGRFCKLEDIIKLKWLPITERRNFNLLKITHMALNSVYWPSTCHLDVTVHTRTLRNSDTRIKPSVVSGTFQDFASKLFNELPPKLKNENVHSTFCKNVKGYLLDVAMARSLAGNWCFIYLHIYFFLCMFAPFPCVSFSCVSFHADDLAWCSSIYHTQFLSIIFYHLLVFYL